MKQAHCSRIVLLLKWTLAVPFSSLFLLQFKMRKWGTEETSDLLNVTHHGSQIFCLSNLTSAPSSLTHLKCKYIFQSEEQFAGIYDTLQIYVTLIFEIISQVFSLLPFIIDPYYTSRR